MFAINGSTGKVTTVSEVDYEAAKSYALQILAVDKNGGSGYLSSTTLLMVRITNVNEFVPSFSVDPYTVSLAEDTVIGSRVLSATATDNDSGSAGTVYFTMDPHQKFQLDETTGKMYLKSSLDYETTASYDVVIYAKDKGTPARTGTSTVSITVTDINDIDVTCSSYRFTKTYAENFDYLTNAATDPVATLSCSDVEASPNGDLAYSIDSVNGVVSSMFTVDSTGVVMVDDDLDFEADSNYLILVKVQDGGTPATSVTVQVYVEVSDVNEAAPVFTGQPSTENIAENAAIGTTVTTITATDSDTSDVITYSFSSASQHFTIDPSTGDIILTAALNYESVASYSLTVVATDSNNNPSVQSSTHALSIVVVDSNDVTPVFDPSFYFVTTAESTTIGTTVLTVTATDGDAGVNGQITYSITGGDTNSDFRMNGASIIINKALDFEMVSMYSLAVTATDGGGLHSSVTAVIDITNLNDNNPVFSPSIYTVNYDEDLALDSTITTVTASDDDLDVFGDITYSIVTNTNMFTIDSQTGEIVLLEAMDRESSSTYAVVVKALDGGGLSGKSFSQKLVVLIREGQGSNCISDL